MSLPERGCGFAGACPSLKELTECASLKELTEFPFLKDLTEIPSLTEFPSLKELAECLTECLCLRGAADSQGHVRL